MRPLAPPNGGSLPRNGRALPVFSHERDATSAAVATSR